MEFSILKDAIDAIANLARKPLEDSQDFITRDYFGRPYYKTKSGSIAPLNPPELPVPDVLHLNSLDALAKMIQEEGIHFHFQLGHYMDTADVVTPKLFVLVDDERNVYCRTSSAESTDCLSNTLYRARCNDTGNFCCGCDYGHEEFMIALRSQFQPSEDRDYLLQLLSSVTSEATVRSEDNGLNQEVSVNKGIRNVSMQPVKSIVRLRPYRTFQEVEQPESEFLVRLSVGEDGSIRIALHEADGGMWKMDARRRIADYLSHALYAEIEMGAVVVTA